MISVALLGCGRIGRMHADNLVQHPGANLVAVYDLHGPSAAATAETHAVRAMATDDEVFAASDIDAVVVASVTSTHADYIEKAVAAGKAVLCEKPIDLDLDRVNRCAATIAGSSTPVQIGFNRRFDPGHRRARDAVLEGAIGDLHQVVITSRDPEMPPRSYYETAGGLFRDMTIHDFDFARFMLHDEPVEVFAMANGLIDPTMMTELGDHDTAMIVMRTADGKQCHINNSRTAAYGYDQRIELMGTTGMLVSDNRRPNELRHYSANAVEAATPYLDFFIERYLEAFNKEVSAFVDSVENGTPPQVSFEDGRRALVLAEAAYRSLAEQRLVQVSEID